MGIRCGVDIVEIDRIRAAVERQGARFLNRIFTRTEQADCTARGSASMASYAARFAAKEAVAKALGTGIGAGAAFLDIEIVKTPQGAPQAVLHGAAARTFATMGGHDLAVSLSHNLTPCVAQAVFLTDPA